MKDLIELLNSLKETIKRHYNKMSTNEQLTRYAIIDPILKQLNWDISNPSIVIPEYKINKLSCDYAFFADNSDQPFVIIESKSINSQLVDKKQIGSYIANSTARFAIFSDGITWKLFDFSIQPKTDPNDRIVLEINIENEPANIIAIKLLCLSKENLFSETPFFINGITHIAPKTNENKPTISKTENQNYSNHLDIIVKKSWRGSNCICFPKKLVDLFPEPKVLFTLRYDEQTIKTSISSSKNPTRITGLSDFWKRNIELMDGDKIRINIVTYKEEYVLEILK